MTDSKAAGRPFKRWLHQSKQQKDWLPCLTAPASVPDAVHLRMVFVPCTIDMRLVDAKPPWQVVAKIEFWGWKP